MRIRSKLLINAVIIILCLIIVGGIGLFYVHSVASVSMSLVDDQAIPLLKINALEKSVWEMRSRLIV
ncbi:MAG: hypothetical protein GY862_35795, partial [Gammaproteobacteria bacterium]|nr:hypothetical protein [Gammaproteobacteria bacterium]